MTTPPPSPPGDPAAEVALAMSECMNLLLLFAAPRVFTIVQETGAAGLDTAHALGSLRRFLRQANGIRSRAPAVTGDVARLVSAAMIVEEIAGALGAVGLSDPLPAAVVDRARRALELFGFPAPPGGWDAFEGFSVPLPSPPSPRPPPAA
jgi:hypothetical protein